MKSQIDLLEEVNHNLGRAEALRDAVLIVKSYAEHIRNQADERESSIREHLKAFPEGTGTYYSMDDPQLVQLRKTENVLNDIITKLVKA
tara:strand:+ start:3740 stop:4006 length:267 start_codon:yes stop_codon:yes gene_type:complete